MKNLLLLCTLTATLLGQTPEEKNILGLDTAMFTIYDKELAKFQANLLATTPIIVARFTGAGGQLTLYRPNEPPLMAPSPPILYQIAKSVGHSVLTTYELSAPYLATSKSDASWKPLMKGFQEKVATALKGLPGLSLTPPEEKVLRFLLENINAYLTKCLTTGSFEKKDLDTFADTVRPTLPELIKIGAGVQVKHQMQVLAEWKALLGDDWTKTYAVTNAIYVTRQNNMLFSILAEFMGQDAINHRLLLLETTSFTTTDEVMLGVLSRILSDRRLGKEIFGNYYLMDSELIANGGRQIIVDTAKTYGLPDILPAEEPFNSTAWPWRHNPQTGTGPANLEEVMESKGSKT